MPMVTSRRFRVAALLALLLMAAGCGAMTINRVLADPAKYRDQSITVRGTVDESVSILGRGAYRITDDGQSLWVVATGGTPRKGARVDVTGRLQEGYDLSAFGNVLKLPGSLRSGLVLIESSRKARD
jgi:hypothetical protein